MENKITEILDLIVTKEADLFTDEGLVFSGFSIPQKISERNECFKGWSQSFSMKEAVNDEEGLAQFVNLIRTIDYEMLIGIYKNSPVIKGSDEAREILKDLGLININKSQLTLTDKGICFLTSFLALKNVQDRVNY